MAPHSGQNGCEKVRLFVVIGWSIFLGGFAPFNMKRALFISPLDLKLRKKLVKRYISSMALYGAETWTIRTVDQKHLGSFEMWRWRWMKIS